jgi:hypothetical protein
VPSTGLLHALQLASKTAVTLSGALDRFNRRLSRTHLVLSPPSEVGSNVVAGCVLTSAAKVINVTDPLSTPDVRLQFEELLKNAGDPDGKHQQSIACATIVYHSSRMEAVCYSSFTRRSRDNTFISQAWKEGNYTVAEFYVKKDHRWAHSHSPV